MSSPTSASSSSPHGEQLSPEEERSWRKINENEQDGPSTDYLLSYAASRLRTAARRCLEQSTEFGVEPWWQERMNEEITVAMQLSGEHLIHRESDSIPGIIRVLLIWMRDGMQDSLESRYHITRPNFGVTRALPSYWDDWWNDWPDKITQPREQWYDRYRQGDYRGVLHYANQVGIDWSLRPAQLPAPAELEGSEKDLLGLRKALQRNLDGTETLVNSLRIFKSQLRSNWYDWLELEARLSARKDEIESRG